MRTFSLTVLVYLTLLGASVAVAAPSGQVPGDATGITGLWALWREGGALAAAITIIIAFLRGWVVPAWAYTEIVRDRDFWRERAGKLAEVADRSVAASERIAEELDEIAEAAGRRRR